MQKKPRQQDDFQKEIQAATERQQTSDDQLKHHRKSQEGVLRGLPMTTTTNDFQRFIRAEKDKQHVYTQDQDWPAVNECMMEIKSLASRQTRLGELEQMEAEKYMECEEQIRSINHKMNVAEVNDVQSVQEQVKFGKEKQALAQEQDAWKALMDMRNSLKSQKNPILLRETRWRLLRNQTIC